jgi:TatA/E family protein of Tat protein translocase
MLGGLFENPLHLWLLLFIVLIFFGAGKLPEAAKGLGQSVKSFKRELAQPDEQMAPASTVTTACPNCAAPVAAGARFCVRCGTDTARVSTMAACPACQATIPPNARFCSQCGTAIVVPASAVADR